MIIDFHTHAFPDEVAKKAIPKLTAASGLECHSDGTVSCLISRMDEAGIDRAVVLNIATNPKQQTNVNNFAIELNKNERIYSLGSLNPLCDNIKEEAKRLRDAGIRGVKVHPDYMGPTIDDAVYDPIFSACIDNDLFVITHSGWDFISPDFIHASPERILKVIEKFPELKFVSSHMGANKQWDEVEKFLIGKNIWLDTSLVPISDMSAEQCERMIKNHDPDKILFGSDFPWCSMKTEIEFMEFLDISAELRAKIYSENALKLFEN